jgi:hypothetical protein
MRKVYDGAKQVQQLTMELNCIGWAAALMSCVYDFVDDSDSQILGSVKRTFELPRMQFVQCGLAILKTEDCSAFLLEEFIEADVSGMAHTVDWFVKYLNNDSAKPRSFADPEKTLHAQFLYNLLFFQRQLFLLTCIFLGGRTLLTDPQIITDP